LFDSEHVLAYDRHMRFSSSTRSELVALFAEIIDADPGSCHLSNARRVVGGCQRLRSLLAARDAEFTPVVERLQREAAAGGLAPEDGDAEPAANSGAGQPSGGCAAASDAAPAAPAVPPSAPPRESAKDRARRELRAKWLGLFTTVAEALADGRISPEHADRLAAICQALQPWIVSHLAADQARLVVLAQNYATDGFGLAVNDWVRDIRNDRGVSEFDQQLADSGASMWFDPTTGMYHLHVVLDPRRGPILQDALDQRTAQLLATELGRKQTRRQLMAQALIDLVTGQATIVPNALVVVDHDTAVTGWRHEHTVCENVDGVPLPIDQAVLACATGNVTAAILDRAGKPADLATSQHLASAEQRLDLRSMHPRCAHPDCGVPFSRTQMHHVVYWSQQGRTLVSNLVPLCTKHHHDIHDRGWRMTMDEGRTCHWYRPDGSLYATVPPRRLDRRPVDANGAARTQSVPPSDGSADVTLTAGRPTATTGSTTATDDRTTATDDNDGPPQGTPDRPAHDDRRVPRGRGASPPGAADLPPPLQLPSESPPPRTSEAA
jgi:HNH endonuclease